jgi:hypothetical protein
MIPGCASPAGRKSSSTPRGNSTSPARNRPVTNDLAKTGVRGAVACLSLVSGRLSSARGSRSGDPARAQCGQESVENPLRGVRSGASYTFVTAELPQGCDSCVTPTRTGRGWRLRPAAALWAVVIRCVLCAQEFGWGDAGWWGFGVEACGWCVELVGGDGGDDSWRG